MATRVERRSLRERVKALMRSVTRLWNRHGGYYEREAPALHGASAVQFHSLLKQTRSLERIARSLNPQDRAWEYYDKEMGKISDKLQSRDLVYISKKGSVTRSIVRESKNVFSAYVLGWLRQALQMIEGSLSRTRPSNIPQLQTLSSRMFYGIPEERQAAREVLADALEEAGYVGEANAIRRDRWSDDKRVLDELGVLHPRSRPYPAPSSRRDSRMVDVERVRRHRRQRAKR